MIQKHAKERNNEMEKYEGKPQKQLFCSICLSECYAVPYSGGNVKSKINYEMCLNLATRLQSCGHVFCLECLLRNSEVKVESEVKNKLKVHQGISKASRCLLKFCRKNINIIHYERIKELKNDNENENKERQRQTLPVPQSIRLPNDLFFIERKPYTKEKSCPICSKRYVLSHLHLVPENEHYISSVNSSVDDESSKMNYDHIIHNERITFVKALNKESQPKYIFPQPQYASPQGQIYIQGKKGGCLAFASYHFPRNHYKFLQDNEENGNQIRENIEKHNDGPFIYYRNSHWRLYAHPFLSHQSGRPLPDKKYFENKWSYKFKTRTFEGEVRWGPGIEFIPKGCLDDLLPCVSKTDKELFCTTVTTSWKYVMVFSEDFGFIESGSCKVYLTWARQESILHSTHYFNKDLHFFLFDRRSKSWCDGLDNLVG